MNQMKFAAPYQIQVDCTVDHENIDEFNIVFTETSSFDELDKFVKMCPNHQINIEFEKENYDIEKIISFFNEHENVYIYIHPWELEYLQQYEEKDINYILDKTMPIYNYSLLEWVFERKTKGIYIADDLTYNLEEVHRQCEAHDIELRIVLNKVPTTNPLSLVCPSVQVYRPQDFDFLSQYYSVGEFDCGSDYDWTKAEVLYRRWFIDHNWDSDLDFMNSDLILPYPTQSIPPELTRLRAVCCHRCTMRSENICSKCRRLLLMGYQNADNNLVYKDPEYGLQSLEDMVDSIVISKDNNIK